MSGLHLRTFFDSLLRALPERWTDFAALVRRASSLSRWQLAFVILWLLCALLGAADIALRASRALADAPQNALAVGPGFSGFRYADEPELPAHRVLIPARLTIPAIGVDAAVEHVGVDAEGAMEVPSSFGRVAWYEDGSRPGEAGNAVLSGHVNNALTTAGVFEHLNQLRLGDRITISNEDGSELSYLVESAQVYGIDDAPTAEIFSRSGSPRLVLITCDGAWDQGRKMFDKRLVVYASLVQ